MLANHRLTILPRPYPISAGMWIAAVKRARIQRSSSELDRASRKASTNPAPLSIYDLATQAASRRRCASSPRKPWPIELARSTRPVRNFVDSAASDGNEVLQVAPSRHARDAHERRELLSAHCLDLRREGGLHFIHTLPGCATSKC